MDLVQIFKFWPHDLQNFGRPRHLATSPSRAVPKMANYRPALILSYRDYMFNDFDYSEAVKMIYSGRGPGRTTTSAAKLSVEIARSDARRAAELNLNTRFSWYR